jgi:hypothetical protein
VPNSIAYLNWTPMFEGYVARWVSENGYQIDKLFTEIGLFAPNMISILSSIIDIIGESI